MGRGNEGAMERPSRGDGEAMQCLLGRGDGEAMERRWRGDEEAIEGRWRGHQGAIQYKLGEEAMKGQ